MQPIIRTLLRALSIAAATSARQRQRTGQTPLKILVGFPPGGSADVMRV